MLVLRVELRSGRFELLDLEGLDLDTAPALRRADQCRVHPLEHGTFAKGIRDDLHPAPLLARQALEQDLAPQRVLQKVGWVREGAEHAGRDPDAIELNALVFVVEITDDPSGVRGLLAQSTGMAAEQVAGCPIFLTGSGAEIRDRLQKQRERTGIR
jgi:hypothetical protein